MRLFITLVLLTLLVFLGVILFGGDSKKSNQVEQPDLVDYADTAASAVLITEGVITGDDQYREIRITVNSTSRKLDIIQGYNDKVISSTSYGNNQNAYSAFLSSLDNLGFTKTRNGSASTSPQGACPLGQRFIYQLTNTGNKDTDQSLWNSSCGGGSFGGNGQQVRNLFQLQITDYSQLTAEVEL